MGADLRPEAVLERGDDAPAVRVVLRVRGGDDQHVQGQAQDVAADLDVALLHDGEERDLDALGEVRQLVDRDDPAMRPGHQAEVDGLRVAQAATLRDLDGVDVADHVRDGGVRGGELLHEPLRPVPPDDRQLVALGAGAGLRRGGDRVEGVLRQVRAGDRGRPLVQQGGERAQQPRLALSALPQQHDVVAGDEGALDLRQDGVAQAVETRPRIRAGGQRGQQVPPQLLPQRAGGDPRRAETAQRRDRGLRGGGGGVEGRHTSTLDRFRAGR